MKLVLDPQQPGLLRQLIQHANGRGGEPAYLFLDDRLEEAARWSFAELDWKARAIGRELQRRRMAGERALLLFPAGLDFVAGFIGCLYAGVIAVPCPVPRPNRRSPRLDAILADATPALILTTGTVCRKLAGSPVDPGIGWLPVDEIPEVPAGWDPAIPSMEVTALLQYTSGSTADPKGVMISHGNMAANLAMVREAFRTSSQSRVVSWLPHFHDMGLIAGILQSLSAGALGVLMAPETFFFRPLNWLTVISRYGGTISGAPDFAYDLCVRQGQDRIPEDTDLKSWRVAFSGAETVRPATIRRFTETFQPYGLAATTLQPCYGLAEATLIVSGGEAEERPVIRGFDPARLSEGQALHIPEERGRSLAGCGRVRPPGRLLIVDPDRRRELEDGLVGEIWLSGPHVAGGYWNRPEESRDTFGAHLVPSGEGPFMRTGDLGFVSDGQIFIVGRIKDNIIIRGQNLHAADIEQTIESAHPACQPHRAAAFSFDPGDGERLVIVQEVRRTERNGDLTKLVRVIRQAVADGFGLRPHAVVLIRPHRLPITSSGKVMRAECRRMFLENRLEVLAQWRADTTMSAVETSGRGDGFS
jgi:acyl-CoA synthetase (AMP-forming)/AMP-acid ligase II